MIVKMPFNKMDRWDAYNSIGVAISPYLKERVTPVYCPPEAMKELDRLVDDNRLWI